MTTQAAFWFGAGAALAVALVAALLDRRRHRRRDVDAVGWVPWRGIQVAAFFVSLACAFIALFG